MCSYSNVLGTDPSTSLYKLCFAPKNPSYLPQAVSVFSEGWFLSSSPACPDPDSASPLEVRVEHIFIPASKPESTTCYFYLWQFLEIWVCVLTSWLVILQMHLIHIVPVIQFDISMFKQVEVVFLLYFCFPSFQNLYLEVQIRHVLCNFLLAV